MDALREMAQQTTTDLDALVEINEVLLPSCTKEERQTRLEAAGYSTSAHQAQMPSPFQGQSAGICFQGQHKFLLTPAVQSGRQSHQFSLKRNSKGRRMQVSKTGSSKPVWKSST